MISLPPSYDCIETYTSDLCDFISSPLIRQITGGIHVNDSLIQDAWGSLPKEWTAWWSSWPDHRLAQQNLIDSIDEEAGAQMEMNEQLTKLVENRPESLTEWLRSIKSLALPRKQRPGESVTLPESLTARMTPKKIAEVSRAAAYIHQVCQSKGINRVIDMGSGQGHLSIRLAYLFPDLKVLSIDGSKSQVAGSKATAAALNIPDNRLEHMEHWIDGSPALADCIEKWAEGESCILVGLHACGSLSEHMLRYFTTIPCIKALGVVGCCYNHIVPLSPSCPNGFPISSTMRKHNLTLSPTALMTGCQAPNNWGRQDTEGGQEEASSFAKRRLYRAILQKAFFDKGVKVRAVDGRWPGWGIRKGDVADFATFARRAMQYLNVNDDEISTEELVAYEERYGDCEGQIAILWALGSLCSKVVESVVAMDRYWFLKEQKAEEVDIIPIFDFKVSPRNFMIVAEKADS